MVQAIAIASVVVFTLGGALGQRPPAFEVASVKPSRTAAGVTSAEFSPGGERFDAANMPLGGLIVMAYGITPRQLSPLDPIVSEKYDIQAKADHAATRDDMLRMLQTLLADRFRLKIRREMREAPAYALVTGKRGPKLHLSEEQLPWTFSRSRGREQKSGGTGRIIFKNESMQDFAFALTTLVVIGRVVVDETGLKGEYDFELSFAAPEVSDPNAPSIFTAVQEQLGLKLEPLKAPIEFLVIEHVERPSAN